MYELGTVVKDNKFGPFMIIEDLGVSNHIHNLVIKFLEPNMYGFNTIRQCQSSQINKKNITDFYKATLFDGNGCKGFPVEGMTNNKRYYVVWCNMMRRCYDKTASQYQYYGALGVKVCDRWRCYEYFLKDLYYIPNFTLWENNPGRFSLDKDILQRGIPNNQKIYSLQTCIFIDQSLNDFEMNYRKNIDKVNYIGVRKVGRNSYNVYTKKSQSMNFDDEIAAASMYNKIARRNGCPEEYLNKLDNEMNLSEIRKHVLFNKINNGYELCKIIGYDKKPYNLVEMCKIVK